MRRQEEAFQRFCKCSKIIIKIQDFLGIIPWIEICWKNSESLVNSGRYGSITYKKSSKNASISCHT